MIHRYLLPTLLKRTLFALSLLLVAASAQADKRIGIIVFDGVLTSDITAPIEVFGIASKKAWFSDYDVITINVGDGATVTSEEGLTLAVDAHLSDRPEVDVLLVPSSYDMDPLLENKDLIGYIRELEPKIEWLASNCSGAFVLAEAGVLDGRKATTWAGGEGDLEDDYPAVDVQYDTNYVIDGNVITSNGSVVSYEAALALLAQMSSEGRADEVRAALQMQRVWKL
ncbi:MULTISPECIES: DJ-1/PfpI family protein [Marinobacter]|uniref:DJ-1/PfpI family protein n=1 Tax=Marinobacter TaxID=2742 RepID=UPI001D0740EF|nr:MULTISPECIES: DJ-1/PfpI family protein [Marinobacter]MCK7565533.1 DJ-1/PfpI family protein [Marinobacter xestospongiae]UDL06322.1 DJ-1/PfpI family protein [Marinobacter sp. CA1]